MSMKQDIEKILQAAGAIDSSIPDHHKYRNDPLAFMEAWLGLTTSDDDDDIDDIDTVEDTPLNDNVYQCIIDWLIHVWKPDNNESSTSTESTSSGSRSMLTNVNHNLLQESLLTPDEMTLDKVWDVVRAVRWMRHWMDLNVVNAIDADADDADADAATTTTETEGSGVAAAVAVAESDNDNDNDMEHNGSSHPHQPNSGGLVERLLQVGESKSNSKSSSTSTALLQALFYHIQYLPVLQSQMDRYTTALQQQRPTTDTSSTSSSTTLLATHDLAASRIQHYQHAQQVGHRLMQEWEEHLHRLETVLGECYTHGTVQQRVTIRKCMGQTWSQFVRGQSSSSSSSSSSSTGGGAVSAASGATGGGLRLENTKAAGLKLTLNVLHRILLGISSSSSLGPAHHHLLFHQLIPLHRVEGMVLWRDQMAVLELYHEPLVQCIAVLLQKQPDWILHVCLQLLQTDIFPATGNTPKQVLLLHEIDTYLGLLDNDKVDWHELIQSSSTASTSTGCTSSNAGSSIGSGTAWMQSLLQVTSRCMASDHSRVSERALALFKNKQFEQIVQYKLDAALAVLIPALVRTEPSWNPTVRKMTYHVLTKLQAYDAEAFARVSNRIFSAGPNMPPFMSTGTGATAAATAAATATSSIIPTRADQAVPPSGLSLKAGMGSWRPPSSAARSNRRGVTGSMPPPSIRPVRPGQAQAQPPATVTGVAPWAHTNTNASASTPSGNVGASSKTPRLPPPSTVTGVAPWAMQPFPGATPPASTNQKRRAPGALLPPTTEGDTNVHASEEINGSEDVSATGLNRVLTYMKQIQPPEEEEGVSSWSKSQMAETPTLLPKLKFHDLVFGHDLGAGAFGSVKYARLIERTKTRSHWAEYAVKVVSTEKIRELGYEASIQREIAVLRILSHPGIARLVSSFRFQEGAYLVLEYASGGDLHTLLRKHGSLDHDSTRFVIGEVVAALASIHEIGLVYADLKPENIVITETGHLKLTDFGGCRPVTEEAKKKTKLIAKGILKNLRDGDWKEQASKKAEDEDDPLDEYDVTDHEEDVRIEGTTAYLPPEVVMGAFPTITADSWALGCVLYQCLTGRPPLLEIDEDSTRNRIVSFDVHESTNQVDRLFQDTHASAIRADARDLIKSLLERDPSKRPGMNQTAQHDFFTKAEVDVFSLYRQPAYPLDVGDVSPSPDAQWARRQFSSIWAPQPVSYNISLPDEDATFTYYDMSRTGPIPEGEEVLGFFSTGASGHLPTKLGHISERAPIHGS